MRDMRFVNSNPQQDPAALDVPTSDTHRRVLGAAKPDLTSGDERGGFEVTVDKSGRILRLRMWGLWDEVIAERFRSGTLKCASSLTGAPWAILADASQFVAQSAAVTQKRKEVMVRAIPMGCTRIAAVVGQAVHSMQFTRIANESHVSSAVFKDEETAVEWIAEGLGVRSSQRTTGAGGDRLSSRDR
jgi:hypothetical protein